MAEPTKQRVPSIGNTIKDGVNLFDDLAEAIANPPADRPLTAAISRSGRLMCDFYGAVPFAARAVFGTSSPIVATLCQPYYDNAGYDGPVPSEPPFTGGQCVGAPYTVSRQNQTTSGPFGSPANSSGTGPVIGPYRDVDGSVARAGIEFASGKVQTIDGPASEILAPTIISITRTDSLPDDCGNIPTAAEPGANPPPNPGPFPPGQDPGVDPDGQPFFYVPPIDPEYPGDEPTEVPVFGPTGQPPPGPPPGPGLPGTPIEATPGDPAEDAADEGEMLWGLKIDLVVIPEGAKEYAPGVFRAVCYVYMGDADGLDHDPAGAMMRDGQFVLAERDYLTHWRVEANDGYTLSVTPYYKPIEATP